MDEIFTVDGQSFHVGVEVVSRTAEIRDGPNASNALSGRRWRDIQGTFIDYRLQISAQGMSQADYDAMYDILTAPVDSHAVTVPYGQSSISFDAYIEVVDDEVEAMDDETLWGNLTVDFKAVNAYRKPT